MIMINRYAYGNAASKNSCQYGPNVLKKVLDNNPQHSVIEWTPIITTDSPHRKVEALSDIIALNSTLAQYTATAVQQHKPFITLGGDHSAAIGSWSGAACALPNNTDLGLIWVDAHMDAHTPDTSTSQNIHGMPLAVLLGHGKNTLTSLICKRSKLKPTNVVLLGTRSFESAEAILLEKLGVTIFDMAYIANHGIEATLKNALNIVTKNTGGFGISIDLDGFDPNDAPGTGTQEPNGINPSHFMTYFNLVTQHPNFLGADIVEFDPTLDIADKTASVALHLINQVISQNK